MSERYDGGSGDGAQAQAWPLARAGRPSLWLDYKKWRRRRRAAFAALRAEMRGDMSSPWRRAVGTFEALAYDHGFVREIYLNAHEVAPGVWRSAQPAPRHLERFAAQGVRTVVNLRGERPCASYVREAEACARLGLTLVNLQLHSRAAPTRERIAELRGVFDRAAHPLLMHCKSGADRAGLASALYLALMLDRPAAEAARQLALRFGHVRQARTGVLDTVFPDYERWRDETGGSFQSYLDEAYDPATLNRRFRAKGWANGLVDGVLRRE